MGLLDQLMGLRAFGAIGDLSLSMLWSLGQTGLWTVGTKKPFEALGHMAYMGFSTFGALCHTIPYSAILFLCVFFFGHCLNFLLNVRNIWSHFGQSARKTFAYSTTIARACSGSMLIKFTKILRVSFCN